MNRESQPEELVAVFSSVDKAAIAVAKMVLDGAGIEYMVQNEKIADLFGYGMLGSGFEPVGSVLIQVAEKNAETAGELLREVTRIRPKKLPLALRIFAVVVLAATLAEIIYTIVFVGKGMIFPR
jgi:hypothetical protein